MPEAVIVSACRTAIGTAFKGSLAETTAMELADAVVAESVRRSGLAPDRFDDVILGESLYGGGDLARHAALTAGLTGVPGLAVNRHCASGLSSVAAAAASIRAGMDDVVIAGGVQSSSTAPKGRWRTPGTQDWVEGWRSPSHPDTPEAPNDDMSVTVGWNAARLAGVSRQEMDTWALRSHQKAIAAIDAGLFADEIVPVKARRPDGSLVEFAVDEHPRRDSTPEKLASLKPLHPEIEGFSITAGNSSGINDAAAALTLAGGEVAAREGLRVLGTVRGWASVGADPVRTGLAPVEAIAKVLSRCGLEPGQIALWEINEAFASMCVAVTRQLGLDPDVVNTSGSGCSLGHPVAASGTRMLTTLVHELGRRGGGLGVAAMCAGGGQAGAVVVEVPGS
ncbi:thiolase family protein [Amycolatopsis acidiphila]|uniref:Probable acetyl-CoA acetyltransferase n=1 Tax=Amycolatopsis acidiphila TaxID=715473 RepID=A0A558AB06_9PSEU|nr:thiolase family protein [Amycolatopsis acidiphila]TVT21450.1 thiolase family protein [Amycolatopsis acidiphila]UIJ63127.1 thiolase family protein [Amycolatopsis acidiphila]GHG73883.1 acetyl-CoA acetyltransferase [Amycolatopsis acidiphila]